MVFLAACTKPELAASLGLNHKHRRKSTDLAGSILYSERNAVSPKTLATKTQTLRSELQSKHTDGDDGDNGDDGNDNSVLMDPGLWITDFLALILASQLIGLLNILNSPEFIRNGGWFQPIPAIPSTLDDLIQRISAFGILWAISSVSVANLSKTIGGTDDATTQLNRNNSDRDYFSTLLNRNIQTLVLFGFFQILFNTTMLGFGGTDGLANQNGIMLLDVLRNCYYVGLSTSGLRYIYIRYFLLL